MQIVTYTHSGVGADGQFFQLRQFTCITINAGEQLIDFWNKCSRRSRSQYSLIDSVQATKEQERAIMDANRGVGTSGPVGKFLFSDEILTNAGLAPVIH